ncbi:zinc finger protein 37-like [Mytilus californianus]|uniref:zinc finger protein 37-like n=1 Tax=Mytilus californianus TaxID=6549 RepID=UPI002245A484|nr:zinc finger protein 37-like [Mytilus californianus]
MNMLMEPIMKIEIHHYQNQLLHSLYELQKKNVICDVALESNRGEIYVHRLVLIANQFMCANLNSYYTELQKLEKKKERIDCTKFSPEMVEALVTLVYTGKIDIEYKHVNDLFLLCDDLNFKTACQAIRQQIDMIDKNRSNYDRFDGYLLSHDTCVMPVTSLEHCCSANIPISVLDIKKECTDDSDCESVDISEQTESCKLPVQVESIKHETSSHKKSMFSIGDTTSESCSGDQNVKLPENLDLHAIDNTGLSFKTSLSNETLESVYPIAAYKTSESGLQLLSQSDTCILHLSDHSTNSESNQTQQLNNVLLHEDQAKLVKAMIRQKILTKRRSGSKRKCKNGRIKTRKTLRQIHDHSEDKNKSFKETSNSGTQDCETEDTNYVPVGSDERGDEFKEGMHNSCEKKDSYSRQCQRCPKSAPPFDSLSEYNKRLKEIHRTICPDKYPVVPCDEEMTKHMKIEAEDESFHDSSSAITALNNTNDQPGYICCFCGKNIKTKSGHRRHEISHSDNDKKRRECHICNKKFVDNAHFLGHMHTHMGYKPYKCEKCKLQYTYKATYKRHLKVCKTPTAKTFKCPMCPQIFERKDVLSDHMIGKHKKGVDQYRCQICNKGFRYRSSKSKHNRKYHQ